MLTNPLEILAQASPEPVTSTAIAGAKATTDAQNSNNQASGKTAEQQASSIREVGKKYKARTSLAEAIATTEPTYSATAAGASASSADTTSTIARSQKRQKVTPKPKPKRMASPSLTTQISITLPAVPALSAAAVMATANSSNIRTSASTTRSGSAGSAAVMGSLTTTTQALHKTTPSVPAAKPNMHASALTPLPFLHIPSTATKAYPPSGASASASGSGSAGSVARIENNLVSWLPGFVTELSKQIRESEQSQIKNFKEFHARTFLILNDFARRKHLIDCLDTHAVDQATGNTILHCTLEKENFYFAAFLIHHGMNFELKNASGQTARSILMGIAKPKNLRLIGDFYYCYSAINSKELIYSPPKDMQELNHSTDAMDNCQIFIFGTGSIHFIEKSLTLNRAILSGLAFDSKLLGTQITHIYRLNNLLIWDNVNGKTKTPGFHNNIILFMRTLDAAKTHAIPQFFLQLLVHVLWQFNLLFSDNRANFKTIWFNALEFSNLSEIFLKAGFLATCTRQETLIDFIPYLRQALQSIDALCKKMKEPGISLEKRSSSTQNVAPHATNNLDENLKLLLDDLEKMDVSLEKETKDLNMLLNKSAMFSKLKDEIDNISKISKENLANNKLSQVAAKLCHQISKLKLDFPVIDTAFALVQLLVEDHNLDFRFIFDFLYPLRNDYAFVDDKLVMKSIDYLNSTSEIKSIHYQLVCFILSSATINLENPVIKAFLEHKINYIFLIYRFIDSFNAKLKTLSSLTSMPITVATTTSVTARTAVAPATPPASTTVVATASASASSTASASTPASVPRLDSVSASALALASASTSTPASATHTAETMLLKWNEEAMKGKIRELLQPKIKPKKVQSNK